MPVSVSGSLSGPGAFGAAIERYGRRSVAQKLRRQGELTVKLAQSLAQSELGKYDGQGARRNKGVSYRNGFEAEYTGLEEFGAGTMTVKLRNRARHARIIEAGSRAHDITANEGQLSWPNMTDGKGALPKGFVVHHPGTAGHHILKRSVSLGLLQGLGGEVAHATVRFITR